MSERRPLTLEELRKNGFTEDSSGVWVEENWLAKIQEEKNERLQGI